MSDPSPPVDRHPHGLHPNPHAGHPHNDDDRASADALEGRSGPHADRGDEPARGDDASLRADADRAAGDRSDDRAERSDGSNGGDEGHSEEGETFSDRVQFAASLVVTCAVLGYLLFGPPLGSHEKGVRIPPPEVVRQAGPLRLEIDSKSKLSTKLVETPIEPQRIDDPVLRVTGTVAACFRPGAGDGATQDGWQFSSPELLSTYTDWQKAQADVAFTETQFLRVKELSSTRIGAQEKVVGRLDKLVKDGAGPEKDLLAERANLIKFQIEGQRDVHEADSAIRIARRSEGALRRQLQQAGLDPKLLAKGERDLDVVMADVPEGVASRVKVGQACRATFVGIEDQFFTGKVDSISPVISEARRSLRVLFIIDDPNDLLRAGMFADIGLGTDARDSLLIPAEGVIHVGRSDFVLVKDSSPDMWRVSEVHVGEPRGALGDPRVQRIMAAAAAAAAKEAGVPPSPGFPSAQNEVEVLSGVAAGDRIIGAGAILLKPAVVKALETAGVRTDERSKQPEAAGRAAVDAKRGDEPKAGDAARTAAGGRSDDEPQSTEEPQSIAAARSRSRRSAVGRKEREDAEAGKDGKTP